MKEHPILFSGDMVRAILEGRKTETRRIIKPQPPADIERLELFQWVADNPTDTLDDCPYGILGYPSGVEKYWEVSKWAVGDRLWVKESFCLDPRFDQSSPKETIFWESHHFNGIPPAVYYVADKDEYPISTPGRSRASIHMPRSFSRITLEVTQVRPELLQDITIGGVIAEGIDQEKAVKCPDAYSALWDKINGVGAWDLDPWVWVVKFRRVEK